MFVISGIVAGGVEEVKAVVAEPVRVHGLLVLRPGEGPVPPRRAGGDRLRERCDPRVQRRRGEVDGGQPRLAGAGNHPVPDAHQPPVRQSLRATKIKEWHQENRRFRRSAKQEFVRRISSARTVEKCATPRTDLKEIADVDEERGGVSRHLDPLAAAVGQEHLQAVDVVGAEHAEDLRVGVLAEPDGGAIHAAVAVAGLGILRRAAPVTGAPQGGGGSGVVVDPEEGVAVGGRDEPAQGRRVPEAQALAEQVQDPAREPPHRVHVLVHCYTAETESPRLELNHHKRLANSC